MLPDKLAAKVNNSQNVKIQPKQNGEVRILSADIALMSSRKNNNDATAIFLNQLLPTKAGRFTSNIVYADACEGLRTDDQALLIRKLFDEYDCDYLVLDTSGLGLGVYDCLSRDIVDPETGEMYPAISCCNNTEMAARCTPPPHPSFTSTVTLRRQCTTTATHSYIRMRSIRERTENITRTTSLSTTTTT